MTLLIWVKATQKSALRAFLFLSAYVLAILLFYSPSPPDLGFATGVSLALADTVEQFAGTEWYGQCWLASMIGSFTIRATKTRLDSARAIQWVLDGITILGIVGTFWYYLTQHLK